jgi:hypothetical protein
MRDNRPMRSLLWILLVAGAKPQLVAGILVFAVARWGWPHLVRILAGGAALALVGVAMLGPSGLSGLLGQDSALVGQIPQTIGLLGGVSGVVGATWARGAITALLAGAAVAACYGLGRRARQFELTPAAALATTALSFLVSFHVLDYGLVVLTPLVVWTIAASSPGEQPVTALLLTCWAALGALSFAHVELGDGSWHPLVPLVLSVLAIAAARPAGAAGYRYAYGLVAVKR